MYIINNDKLTKQPEVRLGDKVYAVNNRLSTFQRMSARLKEGGEPEYAIVLSEALGQAAFEELIKADLPLNIISELVTMTLAAMQGISTEEAQARFRKT